MATFTKVKLSGSTDGRAVKVAATASPGTTIHTADATALDEVWIYAYNSDTASRTITLQWGGTSTPDDDIKVAIPAQTGLTLVVPGLILTNSLVLKAWASVTNVVTVSGFVNRVAP
jgi:hypothetical protein